MTNEAVVSIVVRVAGILLGLESFQVIVSFVFFVQHRTGSEYFWLHAGIIILLTLIVVAMICCPTAIAQILLPKAHHAKGTLGWTVEQFQAVAFSVLGMYFLLSTLTDVSSHIQVWTFLTEPGQSYSRDYLFSWSVVGTFTLRIVAGLWLLLGAKGLANLFRIARGVGNHLRS